MTKTIVIRDRNGGTLNAQTDVGDGLIILHSRSGVSRNRDYREALETIFEKLDEAGVAYEIYLDSRPSQAIPLEQRKLKFSRQSPPSERFNQVVAAMNAGSSSQGAWRKIRIEIPDVNEKMVSNILAGDREPVSRLANARLWEVQAEHIDTAVSRLLGEESGSKFGVSTKYDLITPNGKRLSPKEVFGTALEIAFGIQASPNHFSAGFDHPAFQILEAAGYPIVPKFDTVSAGASESNNPEMSLAEGELQLISHFKRERRPELSRAKKREMIRVLGHLQCERCALVASDLGPNGDAVIEVHHVRTQIADMKPGHVTRLADLQCLCANCHRIVHRELVTETISCSSQKCGFNPNRLLGSG